MGSGRVGARGMVGVRLEDVVTALQSRKDVAPLIVAKKKPSLLAHALSGALSAVLAEVVLFPVDTVKLLTQTAPAGAASSFFSVLVHVLRERGLSGLYRGLGTHVLKESVHSFNYWVFHGFLFRYLTRAEDTSLTPTSLRLLINLLAKQLNWLCTVPFEVVASVNQLAPGSPGFWVTALKLYRQGGVGSFYRGLGISLVLAINPAIMNTLITTGLRAASLAKMAMGMDKERARDHGSAIVGTLAALAKIVATFATYPLIRAKVLQQTSDAMRGASPLAVLRHIVSEEGPSGLYRGVLAMSYKTVLWNTFMMVTKHAIGPGRTLTPPVTPQGSKCPPTPVMVMGREPFVDQMTAEKLDEILEYIRGGRGQGALAKRVGAMEGKIENVSSELQEIKSLLHCLVNTGHPARGAP